MSSLVINTYYDTTLIWSSPDIAWAAHTLTNSLAPSNYSRKRRDTNPLPGIEALHDNVTITSIKIVMVASYPSGYANMGEMWATFAGITMNQVMATGASTLYSHTVTTGLPTPATIRASNVESWVRNIDSFYSLVITCSEPTITIEYIDNGIPYMLQFSL